MHAGKTVQIDSHAAASLNVPGSAATAVGIVGALAAALCFVPGWAKHWLAIWLIAAVLAAGVGGALVLQQFALVGAGPIFARAPVRKFLLCWSPSLLAGAVITAVHWSAGNLDAIPGTWLMLYGCALIGACAVTNRAIGALGVAFFACGVLALLLPERAHVLMLGAGFGGLHLVFGLLMRRTAHGSEI